MDNRAQSERGAVKSDEFWKLHALARGLALAGTSALLARGLHLRMPEPLLLFFVLSGLLFAPILILTAYFSFYPRPKLAPFLMDFLFIAIGYLAFVLYLRYG